MRWVGNKLAISEELIQKIKEENDIVDVVSETVKLKRSGRNYSGLCPFHKEKSPSFNVSSDKQIYKCFGCGEAGNVITFVMKTKSLNFVEAVELLANRANIEFNITKGKDQDKKEILYKLNVDAAKFYFRNLVNNKNARDYFIKRGIKESTLKKFGLGYSLDNWNSLLFYLKKKGYKEEQLLENGLIIKSSKGNYYDRFRNRIIFPVFDYRGKVIGFGGRVLDDSKPKYLNSPEGPIFTKGTQLYGLNFAINNIKDSRTLIIVEGYMDCIALYQNGITNVVASLGTALTNSQAKLIKRFADKVIISYDADLAGQMATLRGLEILRKVGLEVRVLTVPEGKDPDEFIRGKGKEAFIELINNALPLIDYRLKKAKEDLDLTKSSMRIEYGKRVTEILAELDPVEKDVYIKLISEESGIREQALYDLLEEKLHTVSEDSVSLNNMEENGQKLYIEPAYLKAGRALLNIMTNMDEYYPLIISNIESTDFILEEHKKIYDLILEAKKNNENDISRYIESHCEDARTIKEYILIQELEFDEEDINYNKLLNDYLYQIKKKTLEENKSRILQNLKDMENKGMIEESLNLVRELKIIEQKLTSLERGNG